MGEDGIELAEGRVRFAPAVVIQLVVYVVSIVLAYGALDRRITALEAQRQSDAQRLERMENKIDRLLELRRNQP